MSIPDVTDHDQASNKLDSDVPCDPDMMQLPASPLQRDLSSAANARASQCQDITPACDSDLQQQTNVSGNQTISGRDVYRIAGNAHFHEHVHVQGATPTLLDELRQRKDFHQAVEDAGHTPFDLEGCQRELINFYKRKMSQIQLLQWFDDTRDIDDIYVSLKLENNMRQVLARNEDLVTIQTKQGIPAARILVKGVVGSGKSTLMAKLAYLWAQRKQGCPLGKFDLVFILSFRELQRGCDLVDAIFQQILAEDTKVSKVALETYINSYPEKVLILLDGFDEYSLPHLNETSGKVEKLLAFNILRRAHVIVTTRPHKQLGTCQVFYELVQVTGFSEKNVQLYIHKFFRNNSELVEGLRLKLSKSDILNSLSQIPVLLMLMCLLWEDERTLPTTQSELYAEFTSYLWRKFCEKHRNCDDVSMSDFLCSLGKVALKGLMPKENLLQEKLMFDEKDFPDNLERGCQVGILTMERLKSKLRVSRAVTFLHKSFQEYCAAYYWATLFDSRFDEFSTVLQRIDSEDAVRNKFEFLKFCCGLNGADCAITIIQQVTRIYRKVIDRNSGVYIGLMQSHNDGALYCDILPMVILLYESCFPSNNNALTESVKSLLASGRFLSIGDNVMHSHDVLLWHDFVKSTLAAHTLSQVKSIEFKRHPSNSLHVICDTLTHMCSVEEVTMHLPEFESLFDHIEPGIVNKLGVCLSKLNRLYKLVLHGSQYLMVAPYFDVTSILHHLCQTSQRAPFKHIAFAFVELDGDTLSQVLCKQHQVHTLTLCNIQLTSGSMESILDSIEAPLVNLNLSSTHIGDAIAHITHTIFPSLEYLNLQGTGLTESDIHNLCELLPKAVKLSQLNLSENPVGKAGTTLATSLRSCSKVTVLVLENTQMTDEGVVALAETFCHLQNLKQLFLQGNCVGNIGLHAVFQHLHYLPNLDVVCIDATVNSQCSVLVRDCLAVIGKRIPCNRWLLSLVCDRDAISSICQAVRKGQLSS
ncbi:NLR family CARD domain-containing protein 4-like [Amphiura filiformis]|uniref:NLR family CARD domain-containing protein 4-like n=1 Tax=Amphiura filiformis TaxID=82378 RepID=UPI003B20F374